MANTVRVAIAVDTSPKTINFSALTDINGITMATTYATAPRVLAVETTDSLVMGRSIFASTTTTQLRLLAASMGDPLPINILVTLLTGADTGVAADFTLLYIRTKFIDQSGRFDLAVDPASGDYSDNGADFFIRAGQRILDLMQDHPRTVATYQKDLSSGDHKVVFQYNRSVDKVWVTQGGTATDTDRSELIKASMNWIKKEYASPVANIDVETPLYYVRGIIGLSPQQIGLTASGGANPYTSEFTSDWEDIEFGQDNLDKTGIIFFPPSDGNHTIIVKGRWFSRPLINDSDKSFWSVNYDDALVLATQMAVEKSRRNTQGVNDMRGSIIDILFGIDKDMSSDDIGEVDFLSDQLDDTRWTA